MRIRPVLIFTALLSSLLGAVVAYLVLTVPNDLQAGALLREAREEVQEGKGEKARQSLTRVIQQYPRTDAAAAAVVALSALEANERQRVGHQLDVLQRTVNAQTLRIDALLQKVNAPPPPAPAPIVATAPPAPVKAPAKPPARKKPAPKKATHRARHR